MRISRLKIDNYGPLRDRDWDLEPGMNLFFGENESGKTLLVESMVKLLLNGDTDDFDDIDRVKGEPAGFLTVDFRNESIQVPDADYTDLFPEETKSTDLRNAFIIRDIDLRRPERRKDFGQSSYLREVTDRLMGAQTQKIESVKEQIADIGNLANEDSSKLMNRQPKKLKKRRDNAESLVDKLEMYLDRCREEGILQKVGRKRQAEEELESVEADIRELEKAKKQQKLETGRELVESVRSVEQQLESYQERESEIDEYRELRRRIEAYRESDSDDGRSPSTYLKAAAVAIPLFTLSVFAAIFSPVTGMGLIAGVLLLVVLYLGYQYFEQRGEVADREALVSDANYAGFEGDDLPTVYRPIEERIEEYEKTGEELSEQKSRNLGELDGKFDSDHETAEDWAAELESFAEEVEKADREFDADALEETRGRQEELEEEVDTLQRELESHRDRLSEFDNKLQEIRPENYLSDLESARIYSVEDLREAIDILETFVAQLNESRDLARSAIEIFNEIEQEEEQEINQLFTEDEFIVDTFREVTDGNYIDVRYDESDASIRVERADGRQLTPYELSQGTYDLLYLTVRLKLARRLLGDGSGFLILDDAFIHSDSHRTTREIEVLHRLAKEGWQINYFSFREVVRDAISQFDNGTVIDLDPLELKT